MRNSDQFLVIFAIVAIISAAVGYYCGGYYLNTNRAAVRSAEEQLRRSREREVASHEREQQLRDQLNARQEALAAMELKCRQLVSVINETSTFYPSLATAIADFAVLDVEQLARHLRIKPHPAIKRAEIVQEVARARKEAVRRAKMLQYQLSYYENAFPWLIDYSGRSTQDLLAELEKRRRGEFQDEAEDGDEVINRFVPMAEYAKLSEPQRSDLALKRWRASRKSSWQIGRDYERAVGYEFEQQGYSVEYFGAVKGLEDMGRDLIATKDGVTLLIQCKYWAQHKEIHEKHIFQLIGTAFEYACNRLNLPIKGLDLGSVSIEPILITNIRLSETAVRAAERIGVKYQQEYPLKDYPLIKCNVNGSSKIYHLPFDQQYDSARIIKSKGECYVHSAVEANQLGFRRARHHFAKA